MFALNACRIINKHGFACAESGRLEGKSVELEIYDLHTDKKIAVLHFGKSVRLAFGALVSLNSVRRYSELCFWNESFGFNFVH